MAETKDNMQQSIPEIKLLYKIFKSGQRHYETVLNRCKLLEQKCSEIEQEVEQEVETITKQKADAESERHTLSLNKWQGELTECRNMLRTANDKMGVASRELQQALTANRDFIRNAPTMLKKATERATMAAARAAAATKSVAMANKSVAMANKNLWAEEQACQAAREAVLVANKLRLEWKQADNLARILAELAEDATQQTTQQKELRESAKKATEAAEAVKARAAEAEKAAKAVNTEEATRLVEAAEEAAKEAVMEAVTAEDNAELAEEAAKEAAEEQAFLTDIIDRRKKYIDRRKKYEKNQRDADQKKTDAAVMKMAHNGANAERTMALYTAAVETIQTIANGREPDEANLLMKLYRKTIRAKVADAPGQAAEIDFCKVLFIQIMEEEVKKCQAAEVNDTEAEKKAADESLRLRNQIPQTYHRKLERILSMGNIPSLVRDWRAELSIQTGAESKAEVTEMTEAKVEQCGLCGEDLPQSESQFIRRTCCGLGIHVSCGMPQTRCSKCHKQLPSTEEDMKDQLRQHVSQDNPPAWAQYQLGGIHLRKSEYDDAAKWFRLAANQGLAVAQFNLGIMYNDAVGNIQQMTKRSRTTMAGYWFEKAAKQGYALAQHELGLLYKTAQDFENAEKWLTDAAKQEMKEAQFDLGFLYYRRSSYEKAAHWFTRAGKGLEPDYNALYYMGILYYNGYFVDESKANALKCWKKARKGLMALETTDIIQELLDSLAEKITAAESEAAEEKAAAAAAAAADAVRKKQKKKDKKRRQKARKDAIKKEENKLYLRF